ncbi:hypothetical protein CEUSTIGMA_g4989.t1 [Chlamydomonas eustigma]|uniref:Uncharacterized protein n=1 Tax=Chlamydomonas eustigma TaxID=1157962 RepID=A0A250X3B0_9CHLO|nr:hypothetical protein CEUSTIGMA_g4989.t1 [Chlamydomonas eustigma]|eukprot:GAX77545.1 hypothetical protein CEUSTIGMA_g4989.t1 [Chlamydomonas eustigma]
MYCSTVLNRVLLIRKQGFIEELVSVLKSARGCKTACLAAHALQLLLQTQHPVVLRLSAVIPKLAIVVKGMLAADPVATVKPLGPGSDNLSALRKPYSSIVPSMPCSSLESRQKRHMDIRRHVPGGHRYCLPVDHETKGGSSLADDQEALRLVLRSLLRLLNTDGMMEHPDREMVHGMEVKLQPKINKQVQGTVPLSWRVAEGAQVVERTKVVEGTRPMEQNGGVECDVSPSDQAFSFEGEVLVEGRAMRIVSVVKQMLKKDENGVDTMAYTFEDKVQTYLSSGNEQQFILPLNLSEGHHRPPLFGSSHMASLSEYYQLPVNEIRTRSLSQASAQGAEKQATVMVEAAAAQWAAGGGMQVMSSSPHDSPESASVGMKDYPNHQSIQLWGSSGVSSGTSRSATLQQLKTLAGKHLAVLKSKKAVLGAEPGLKE